MLLCVGVSASRESLPNPVVSLAMAFGLRMDLPRLRGFWKKVFATAGRFGVSFSFALGPVSCSCSFKHVTFPTYDDDSERPWEWGGINGELAEICLLSFNSFSCSVCLLGELLQLQHCASFD